MDDDPRHYSNATLFFPESKTTTLRRPKVTGNTQQPTYDVAGSADTNPYTVAANSYAWEIEHPDPSRIYDRSEDVNSWNASPPAVRSNMGFYNMAENTTQPGAAQPICDVAEHFNPGFFSLHDALTSRSEAYYDLAA